MVLKTELRNILINTITHQSGTFRIKLSGETVLQGSHNVEIMRKLEGHLA